MNFSNLRRWHWLVIGVLLGLTVGQVRVMSRPEPRYDDGIAGQDVFERKVSSFARDGRPQLDRITVYPGESADEVWVVGQMAGSPRREVVDGKIVVSLDRRLALYVHRGPFTPLQQPEQTPAHATTLLDYLLQVQQRQSEQISTETNATRQPLQVRYAWWSEPQNIRMLWLVVGVVYVGFAWPALLDVLVRLKLAPVPRWEVREKPAPRPRRQPAAPLSTPRSPDGDAQLAELNASLEAQLGSSGQLRSGADAAPVPVDAPVRLLNAGPSNVNEDMTPQAGDDPREYKGEFYPVARPVVKKGDE